MGRQSLATMFTLRAGRAGGSTLHSSLSVVPGLPTEQHVHTVTPHSSLNMPAVITVPDFIRETKEDIASPTTSTFVNRIPQCRETINRIDEVENVTL